MAPRLAPHMTRISALILSLCVATSAEAGKADLHEAYLEAAKCYDAFAELMALQSCRPTDDIIQASYGECAMFESNVVKYYLKELPDADPLEVLTKFRASQRPHLSATIVHGQIKRKCG